MEVKVFFLGMLVLEMMLAAKGDSIASMSLLVGLPTNSSIFSIWLRVLLPGNMDLLLISSPKMHPTDHISTAFEYLVDPSNI